MSANRRTNDAADQLSGLAEPAGSPSTKPIDAVSGAVPNGEGARFASSQSCSGMRPTPPANSSIPSRRDAAPAASPVCSACSARSADNAGQTCPVPTPDGAHGAAVAGTVAVAVAVVAVPARSAVGIGADRRVHDGQRCEDVRVVRGQLAEPGELEEPGVDHRALVERRPAVADVVRDRGVRIAGLGETDEVARCERAVGRHRPALDRALVVVGDAAPHGRRDGIVIGVGEVGGRHQPGDLGRDRRRRVAAPAPPSVRRRRRGRGSPRSSLPA